MKLRILFSHYGYKFGGGFSRTYQLAKELALLGHDITFLTSQKDGFIFPYIVENIDNLKIISFPDIVPKEVLEKGFGILTPILKTFYIINKRYDILHLDSGHRPNSGLPCFVHRYIFKSKLISEWWDFFGKGGQYDLRPFWSKFTLGTWDRITELITKKESDGVVALSKFTKDRAIANGVPENAVTIIHGGCDVRKIMYQAENTSLKLKYGIAVDSLTFGFIGMMKSEFYDIVPFVEACSNLRKKGLNINWITTGIKLKREIKDQYEIGDELIEYGWLAYENFCEVISIPDVYILLSRENAMNRARWPNKIGDYMAAGRLILANPVGELIDIMNSYPTSFISSKWESEDIENIIIKIMNNKPSLLKLGKVNRLLAEEVFSWHNRALELQNFYKKVL